MKENQKENLLMIIATIIAQLKHKNKHKITMRLEYKRIGF